MRLAVWISLSLVTLAACREPRTLTSPSASSPPPAETLITVDGGVQDTLAEPVSGASVEIVGVTGASAITDSKGRCSISFQGAASQALVVRIAKDGLGLTIQVVELQLDEGILHHSIATADQAYRRIGDRSSLTEGRR